MLYKAFVLFTLSLSLVKSWSECDVLCINAYHCDIYFQEEQWLDITYSYDGNFFSGSCNGKTFKQRTGGKPKLKKRKFKR